MLFNLYGVSFTVQIISSKSCTSILVSIVINSFGWKKFKSSSISIRFPDLTGVFKYNSSFQVMLIFQLCISQWISCLVLCFSQAHTQLSDCNGTQTHNHLVNEQPVWLNGWVLVYELSGCGFEYRCKNFRFRACFEQGVPWHSGNYRVWIHSETRTWHDKNIQTYPITLSFLYVNVVTSKSLIKSNFISIDLSAL